MIRRSIPPVRHRVMKIFARGIAPPVGACSLSSKHTISTGSTAELDTTFRAPHVTPESTGRHCIDSSSGGRDVERAT
jgi:hypothetical protein